MSSEIDDQLPTYPSRPIAFIDIPEPTNPTADFQYNFFTTDEAVSSDATRVLLDLGIMSPEDITSINQSSRLPRYVELKWSMVDFNSFEDGSYRENIYNTYSLSDIKDSLGADISYDNIMDEEAISNAFFTAAAMQDTGADTQFYQLATGVAAAYGIDFDTNSGNTIGDTLARMIGTTSLIDPSGKKLLMETLSNLQSQGATFAQSDTNTAIDSFVWTPVRNLKFNFNINNLIISSLLKSSAENTVSLFEDEIRAALLSANKIQSNAILNSTPGSVDISGDYDFEIAPLHMSSHPITDGNPEDFNEGASLVGYIIEKQEILPDGSLIQRDPIMITSKNVKSVKDPYVRYGGAYIYTVKSIAVARFEAMRGDPESSNADQIVIADVLIKSKGATLTVNCFESVPPPPPNNLKFHYDFDQDNLVFFWDFPVNPQRDIKRFQIFRRKSISEPFTILKEYDFDDSESKSNTLERTPGTLIETMKYPSTLYVDNEFNKSSSYIYAVCAIDARGLTSNYSSQFLVQFDSLKQSISANSVSIEGAPKSYPNMYLSKDLFVDTIKDSGHSRINLYFDPEYLDVLSGETGSEKSLSLFSMNSNERNPDYRLQIINTDLQQGEIVNIYIRGDLPDDYYSYTRASSIELSSLGGLSFGSDT